MNLPGVLLLHISPPLLMNSPRQGGRWEKLSWNSPHIANADIVYSHAESAFIDRRWAKTDLRSENQIEREQSGARGHDVDLEGAAEERRGVAQLHEVQADQAYLDQGDRHDRAADQGRRAAFDAQQPARQRGQDEYRKDPHVSRHQVEEREEDEPEQVNHVPVRGRSLGSQQL